MLQHKLHELLYNRKTCQMTSTEIYITREENIIPTKYIHIYVSYLCVHYSGILPVNAHAAVNILNLNSIDSFIFYSSTTRLSNDIHYNYYCIPDAKRGYYGFIIVRVRALVRRDFLLATYSPHFFPDFFHIWQVT